MLPERLLVSHLLVFISQVNDHLSEDRAALLTQGVGQMSSHVNGLTNDLAKGLGGAFATGPAYPGNHFS